MDIPIQEGQHFKSSHGTIYTVDYLNEDIVLLHDGRNYRLEDVVYFEEQSDAGMFEYLPDLELTDSEVEIPLEEIDLIGEVAAESLRSNAMTRPVDFERVTDERIIDENDGLGEAGLENIYEWVNNNATESYENV